MFLYTEAAFPYRKLSARKNLWKCCSSKLCISIGAKLSNISSPFNKLWQQVALPINFQYIDSSDSQKQDWCFTIIVHPRLHYWFIYLTQTWNMIYNPMALFEILLTGGRGWGLNGVLGSWRRGRLEALGERNVTAGLFGELRPAVCCLKHLELFSWALTEDWGPWLQVVAETRLHTRCIMLGMDSRRVAAPILQYSEPYSSPGGPAPPAPGV